MFATRFARYADRFFGSMDAGKKLIARAPRGQGSGRAKVGVESVARYYYALEKQWDQNHIRAVSHFSPVAVARSALTITFIIVQYAIWDETGWSGFYGLGFGQMQCLAQARFREEVYRETGDCREHVSMLPIIILLIGEDGLVESVHHTPPLIVHPREYVATTLASSSVDPDNAQEDPEVLNSVQFVRQQSQLAYQQKSPKGIPEPTTFERYVAASPSGNVNSAIVKNYWKECVIPFIRQLGVTKEEYVSSLTDLHATHEEASFQAMLRDENIHTIFGVPKGTNWWQVQDGEPFEMLKTTCRTDFDAWHQYFRARGREPKIEDFAFVVQNAYNKMTDEKLVRTALERKGLFPDWNPDAVISKMNGDVRRYDEYRAQFLIEDGEPEEIDLTQQTLSGNPPVDEEDPVEEEDLFCLIGSDPTSNRSPLQKGIRLSRNPDKVTFHNRVPLGQFARAKQLREIHALIHDFQTVGEDGAKRKKGARGKRVGDKGEVFRAEDVAAKKEEESAAKKLKKAKDAAIIQKKKNKANLQVAELAKLKKEVKRLKAENKELRKPHKKKPNQPVKVELPARRASTRRSAKQDYNEDSSSESEESEHSEEDTSDSSGKDEETLGENSDASSANKGDSCDESAHSSNEEARSSDEDEDEEAECVAPVGWRVSETCPTKKLTVSLLLNRHLLVRWDNTVPAWLHGKIVGAPVVEDMDMQEAAVGYTHVVQYTYKDTNHQLRGLCDTLLTRERYGVDKAWVLLDKVEE